MPIVDLALFKKHVRADDFTDDDAYIEHLLEAAEAAVIIETNRTATEIMDANGGYFPPQLRQAVMLLAAHWYNQRESVAAVQMHQVPDALLALIRPLTRLV